MNKEKINIHHTKEDALRGKIIFASKESIGLLDERIAEIELDLINTTRAMGESARNDNDLRENYGFRDLRLKATDELPKKIIELKSKKTKLIEFPASFESNNVINLGDRFTIEMHFLGESEPDIDKFELVGPLEIELDGSLKLGSNETDDVQKISYLSPLGMAVWGVSNQSGTEFSYSVNTNDIRCVVISD